MRFPGQTLDLSLPALRVQEARIQELLKDSLNYQNFELTYFLRSDLLRVWMDISTHMLSAETDDCPVLHQLAKQKQQERAIEEGTFIEHAELEKAKALSWWQSGGAQASYHPERCNLTDDELIDAIESKYHPTGATLQRLVERKQQERVKEEREVLATVELEKAKALSWWQTGGAQASCQPEGCNLSDDELLDALESQYQLNPAIQSSEDL